MAQLLSSQRPTVTVGGRVFTDLTNLIALTATMNAGAAARYSTFRRGSAGYQVTAAKTLKLSAMKSLVMGTGSGIITLGYGDNDVGFTSSAAPTTATYPWGSTSYFGAPAVGNYLFHEFALDSSTGFAATKYPFFQNDGVALICMVLIYGYES